MKSISLVPNKNRNHTNIKTNGDGVRLSELSGSKGLKRVSLVCSNMTPYLQDKIETHTINTNAKHIGSHYKRISQPDNKSSSRYDGDIN